MKCLLCSTVILLALMVTNTEPNGCMRGTDIVPTETVVGADAIVRATVLGYKVTPDASDSKEERRLYPISIEVKEMVKSMAKVENIEILGYLVSKDDYNDAPIPYEFVRPSGRYGSCYAFQYKVGADYLLFLKKTKEVYQLYPDPLAPINEQLHSDTDPWLVWVKGVLAGIKITTQITGKKIPIGKVKPDSPVSYSTVY
jgi:hypothetical protein